MKNDTFFNWLLIGVSLMISIGMFRHGIDYFWIPYIVSLVALCRYTDFLESKEKEKEAVPFPIKSRKWSSPMLISKEAHDKYLKSRNGGLNHE